MFEGLPAPPGCSLLQQVQVGNKWCPLSDHGFNPYHYQLIIGSFTAAASGQCPLSVQVSTMGNMDQDVSFSTKEIHWNFVRTRRVPEGRGRDFRGYRGFWAEAVRLKTIKIPDTGSRLLLNVSSRDRAQLSIVHLHFGNLKLGTTWQHSLGIWQHDNILLEYVKIVPVW